MIVAAFYADTQQWTVSARAQHRSAPWSVFTGTTEELATLLDMARDIATDGLTALQL